MLIRILVNTFCWILCAWDRITTTPFTSSAFCYLLESLKFLWLVNMLCLQLTFIVDASKQIHEYMYMFDIWVTFTQFVIICCKGKQFHDPWLCCHHGAVTIPVPSWKIIINTSNYYTHSFAFHLLQTGFENLVIHIDRSQDPFVDLFIKAVMHLLISVLIKYHGKYWIL